MHFVTGWHVSLFRRVVDLLHVCLELCKLERRARKGAERRGQDRRDAIPTTITKQHLWICMICIAICWEKVCLDLGLQDIVRSGGILLEAVRKVLPDLKCLSWYCSPCFLFMCSSLLVVDVKLKTHLPGRPKSWSSGMRTDHWKILKGRRVPIQRRLRFQSCTTQNFQMELRSCCLDCPLFGCVQYAEYFLCLVDYKAIGCID